MGGPWPPDMGVGRVIQELPAAYLQNWLPARHLRTGPGPGIRAPCYGAENRLAGGRVGAV